MRNLNTSHPWLAERRDLKAARYDRDMAPGSDEMDFTSMLLVFKIIWNVVVTQNFESNQKITKKYHKQFNKGCTLENNVLISLAAKIWLSGLAAVHHACESRWSTYEWTTLFRTCLDQSWNDREESRES